jgi:hypothetical protein
MKFSSIPVKGSREVPNEMHSQFTGGGGSNQKKPGADEIINKVYESRTVFSLNINNVRSAADDTTILCFLPCLANNFSKTSFPRA